jgi:hypothetical protein
MKSAHFPAGMFLSFLWIKKGNLSQKANDFVQVNALLIVFVSEE